MSVTLIYFLLPCAMIIFGIYRVDNIPQMNSKFGFKSKYALINEESYYFANIRVNYYFIRFNCITYLLAVAGAVVYLKVGQDLSYGTKVAFFVSISVIEILGCVLPIQIVKSELKTRYYNEYIRSVIDSHKDVF